jgi:hypothetical protein
VAPAALGRRRTPAEVADVHARALDAEIRDLWTRRAVLRAVEWLVGALRAHT